MSTPFDDLLTSIHALAGLESSNRPKYFHEILTFSIWPKPEPTACKIFFRFASSMRQFSENKVPAYNPFSESSEVSPEINNIFRVVTACKYGPA